MSEYFKKLQHEKLYGKPPEPKKQYSIPKKSKKRLEAEAAAKDEAGDTELVRWFRGRIKQLTGYCAECHARTETKIYQYAIYSVCHILPKRETMCPSVKYHILNWIELCPDHHTMFDNASWEQREMMGCWPIVQQRLIMVYPDLAENERRHFPQSVLTYMEKHNPF